MNDFPDSRHKGAMRSDYNITYAVKSVTAALGDTSVREQVYVQGGLFDQISLKPATAEEVMRKFFAAQHPQTGQRLRGKINEGTRLQKDGRRLSNVCHGFDFTLSADKSVSVAALLFRDKVVMDATFEEQAKALKWLAKQASRRTGKGKDKRSVPAEAGIVMILSPEKASRDNQPHLHTHGFCPNLTRTKLENGDQVWVAVHFGEMARLTLKANHRFNQRLFVRLTKLGYAAVLDKARVCKLPSVPRKLCQELSKGSERIAASPAARNLQNGVSSHRRAKIKETAGRYSRGPKYFHSVEEWQGIWDAEIGRGRVAELTAGYMASRFAITPQTRDSWPTESSPSQTEPVIADSSPKVLGSAILPRGSGVEETKHIEEPDYHSQESSQIPVEAEVRSVFISDNNKTSAPMHVTPSPECGTPPDDPIDEDPMADLLLLGREFRRQYDAGVSEDDRACSWEVTLDQPKNNETQKDATRTSVLRALLKLALGRCMLHTPSQAHTQTWEVESTPSAASKLGDLVKNFAEMLYLATVDLPVDFNAEALVTTVNLEITRRPEFIHPPLPISKADPREPAPANPEIDFTFQPPAVATVTPAAPMELEPSVSIEIHREAADYIPDGVRPKVELQEVTPKAAPIVPEPDVSEPADDDFFPGL